MIDPKFCKHSFNRLLHKSVHTIFLIMSYSAFAAILWQILKSHFERKQSKTDYPKSNWKEAKCVHGFFRSWLYAFHWEKTIENHKWTGAGARKVENLVCFLSSFDPNFPNIQRVRKGCKIYFESIGIHYKNIDSIESMEVTMLESNALLFHSPWRVLWDLTIQFRSMIQLNNKSVWS